MRVINQRKLTVLSTAAFASVAMAFASCGKAPASGNVTFQASPLAGPTAASLWGPSFRFASLAELISNGLLSLVTGTRDAYAAVSGFSKFSACNNTMILLDTSGNPVSVNGSTAPSIGQGLLTFSPSSTTAMTIGTATIPSGVSLSEIDITFAVVPSICQGASYAVEFSDGVHGVIDVTQNTAFKFKFPAGGTVIAGGDQTVNLMFGAIVNGMVALGATLSNSTVQTVNAGQAQ